jgi:hypothetical protein
LKTSEAYRLDLGKVGFVRGRGIKSQSPERVGNSGAFRISRVGNRDGTQKIGRSRGLHFIAEKSYL